MSYNKSGCGEAQPPIPTFADGGHLKSYLTSHSAFSLEVSGFSQCFQEPFRHFTACWAIETSTEFLFVGMAIASPTRVLFTPLTPATSLLHATDQESIGRMSSRRPSMSAPLQRSEHPVGSRTAEPVMFCASALQDGDGAGLSVAVLVATHAVGKPHLRAGHLPGACAAAQMVSDFDHLGDAGRADRVPSVE